LGVKPKATLNVQKGIIEQMFKNDFATRRCVSGTMPNTRCKKLVNSENVRLARISGTIIDSRRSLSSPRTGSLCAHADLHQHPDMSAHSQLLAGSPTKLAIFDQSIKKYRKH
jgi:hypothetical protein